jgi:hypothetical protein
VWLLWPVLSRGTASVAWGFGAGRSSVDVGFSFALLLVFSSGVETPLLGIGEGSVSRIIRDFVVGVFVRLERIVDLLRFGFLCGTASVA